MADTVHTGATPLVSYDFYADPDGDMEYFLKHPERTYRIRGVRRSEGKNLRSHRDFWYVAVRFASGTVSAIFFPSSVTYSDDPGNEPDDAECGRIWNRVAGVVGLGWLIALDAVEWRTGQYHAHDATGTAYIFIDPVPDAPGVMQMVLNGPLIPRTVFRGPLDALLARAEDLITNGDPDVRGAAMRVNLPPAVAWK